MLKFSVRTVSPCPLSDNAVSGLTIATPSPCCTSAHTDTALGDSTRKWR
ncbi:MAG: hypothetical protein R3E42_19500 [Burkholderiaceae bacterium]